MKLKISSIFLLVAVVSLSAFTTIKPVTYTVDVAKSTITWVGKKVTGSHNGTVALQSGTLNVDGKKVTGGTFTIDMNSIKDADGSAKLEGHLKADDFFGTAKFPTATFVITKVAGTTVTGNLTIKGITKPLIVKLPVTVVPATVTGNLTIKGITKPLSFPATVTVNADGTVSALAGKIIVDRTKYDIKYGSKSFFDSIGDKAIDNDFELAVKLVAKK